MNTENNISSKPAVKSFNWYAFPYYILVLLMYLSIGFAFDKWHPTWLLFLTIPMYYTVIATIKSRNWYVFPYYLFAVLAYLIIGFTFKDAWHPTWLIILTIPVYYLFIAVSRAKTFRAKVNIFPYPIICVILYLSMGFDYGWWHPTWLMFLSIPAYYIFVNCFRVKK